MVLNFEVENFLSFGEKQTLSFLATKERNYSDYYVKKIGKYKVLKLAIIYGPNGSGKTNFLYAFDFLREIAIRQPKDKTEQIRIEQFKNKKFNNRPTRFALDFFIHEKLFKYEIKLDKNFVYSEKLSFFPSREALIYQRFLDENKKMVKIKFGDYAQLNKVDRLILKGNTLPNGTVLGAYKVSNVNSPILQDVFDFFRLKLLPLAKPKTNLFIWAKEIINRKPEIKKFVQEHLPFLIPNLTDFEVKRKERLPTAEELKIIEEFGKEKIEAEKVKIIEVNLVFKHRIADEIVDIEENFESNGTRRFIGILTLLKILFDRGAIAPVDELESSLHHELQVEILKFFLENGDSNQLIITTHNLQLLDEDLLRRDVIWLIDNDNELNQSQLFRISDFKVHPNLSLLNLYKFRNFGAYPNINL